MGLASLSDSERMEVEIFYKQYLRQHPPRWDFKNGATCKCCFRAFLL